MWIGVLTWRGVPANHGRQLPNALGRLRDASASNGPDLGGIVCISLILCKLLLGCAQKEVYVAGCIAEALANSE